MFYWSMIDPIFGKVSFDIEGTTFFTPVKTFRFKYTDCKDIGFTSWYGFRRSRIVFYVYFSKIEISSEQRIFLAGKRSRKKGRKSDMPVYLTDYLLFQYEPEVFSGLIESVPSHFRKKLLDEARELGLKSFGEYG